MIATHFGRLGVWFRRSHCFKQTVILEKENIVWTVNIFEAYLTGFGCGTSVDNLRNFLSRLMRYNNCAANLGWTHKVDIYNCFYISITDFIWVQVDSGRWDRLCIYFSVFMIWTCNIFVHFCYKYLQSQTMTIDNNKKIYIYNTRCHASPPARCL